MSAGAVGAEGSAPLGQEQVPGSAAEKLRGGTGPGSLITFLAGESENFKGELSGLGGNGASGRCSTHPSHVGHWWAHG